MLAFAPDASIRSSNLRHQTCFASQELLGHRATPPEQRRSRFCLGFRIRKANGLHVMDALRTGQKPCWESQTQFLQILP